MKDNGFKLAKERSRRYPAQTIMDVDYTVLANTSTQAGILLHSLERAAAGISHHVNEHQTEYMCFNQRGNISTQSGSSPKLVDMFTFQGSIFSSIKTNINTHLAKAGTVNDRISVIWKSDLTK